VITRSMDFVGFPLSSGIKSAGAWCVHASSFANPIIYSSLRADLRKAMFSILKCNKLNINKVFLVTETKVATASATIERLSMSFRGSPRVSVNF